MMWVKCFVWGFMAALGMMALLLPGEWSTTFIGRYRLRGSRLGGRMRAPPAGLLRWIVMTKDKDVHECDQGYLRGRDGETLTKLQGQ